MSFAKKTMMKIRVLIVMVMFTLFLTLYNPVHGESQVKYTIQIGSDRSATWTIIRWGDIQITPDTLAEFQNKVTSLLEAARNKTGRDMDAHVTSVTITPSESYIVVEYKFSWTNFSKIEDTRIIVSDVFQVENFFHQLYDDGQVYILYPPEYILEAVWPPPYEQNPSLQTLSWLGTNDFKKGEPSITLREKSTSFGLMEFIGQNALLIIGATAFGTMLSASFYIFLQHMRKKSESLKKPDLIGFPNIDTEEDKIIKLLKSSGGSLRQSAIVDQLRFSKAKVSQLLTALENKGAVKRYKKGRDKIVVLHEKKHQ